MSVPIANERCRAFFDLPLANCAQCDNSNGLFKCYGCYRSFCEQHAIEHRQPLRVQLHALREKNDILKTDVDETVFRAQGQRLLQQIDHWEDESKKKITRAAEEARRKVSDMVRDGGYSQVKQLLQCRQVFSERLKQADIRNDYHERHLEFWVQFYQDLEQNFVRMRTSQYELEYCSVPFISKILVRESSLSIRFTKWCYYERACPPHVDIRRTEGSQHVGCTQISAIEPCEGTPSKRITYVPQPRSRTSSPPTPTPPRHTPPPPRPTPTPPRPTPTPPRLENGTELRTGEYRLRIHTGCIFIGIISKRANFRSESLAVRSVYGWNGDSIVYLDGEVERNYRGYQSDMQMDDTVSLIVNCEQGFIRLVNLDKDTTYEIVVDMDKCPLPWLAKIRVFERE